MKKVLFVGLDVDDKAFHACGVEERGERQFEFSCRPNGGVLRKKLEAYAELGVQLRVCYEATYIGFSLQRQLSAGAIHCDVIAPSLVPIIPGECVKTNRLDSLKLADYYSKGQLTVVHVPSEDEEAVRDLVRGRKFLTEQIRRQKQYVLSLCRRMGLDYRAGNARANYWTGPHMAWLERQVKEARHRALRFNLGSALDRIRQMKAEQSSYEVEIEYAANQPFYRRQVQALCCFRGIDVVSAMTLITEIGDVGRFAHPSRLPSYAGMDLREYSSGTEKRWGITKMGNRHIRTTAVESSQYARRLPRVSKQLKKRREGAEPLFIEIADRCMRRLHKKSTRLTFRGKHTNTVKMACARELLCFVWEALKAAA